MITVDFRRLGLCPGKKILDIGSGPGRHTGAAARINGVTAVGADISWPDLHEARNRLRFQEAVGECRGRWGLLATDILSLPFADATFDVVICAEVMEHVADDGRAAAEITRVLKPGGNLAVSVPRFFPEKICWMLSKPYARLPGGHVRIYTKGAVQSLLEKHAAVLWSRHHAHSLHTPFWWLKCLVGVQRTDNGAVNRYHRFLVWDLMKKPAVTRFLDRLLNPVLGKSLVCYFRKSC